MNINLLISMAGKLVIPYPAIQRKWFWIFLAAAHIWVGVIAQKWRTWRRSRQIPLFLLELSMSLNVAGLTLWPRVCTLPPSSSPVDVGGRPAALHGAPVPKPIFSKTLSPLCLSRPLKELHCLQFTACIGEQECAQSWTLQKGRTLSEHAGELMEKQA